jgi:hypothetical protein
MEVKVVFALFLISLASVSAASSLYGIVTTVAANETQTVVYTVSIDPKSGNFTFVGENFVNIGDSATFDGICGFDQKNEYLYYATDFESSFVFGMDVSNGQIRPPISAGALSTNAILYDQLNEQILLTLGYNGSGAIISFPSSPSAGSQEVYNFTSIGILPTDIFCQAIDNSKGVYYFVYYKGSSLNLGSFTISAPTDFKTTAWTCSDKNVPIFIDYDVTLAKFVGISTSTKGSDYYYYEIVNGKCDEKNLKLGGIVTCVTYDPTETALYFGYATNEGAALEIYNASSHQLSAVPTSDVLEDIQAAYSI